MPDPGHCLQAPPPAAGGARSAAAARAPPARRCALPVAGGPGSAGCAHAGAMPGPSPPGRPHQRRPVAAAWPACGRSGRQPGGLFRSALHRLSARSPAHRGPAWGAQARVRANPGLAAAGGHPHRPAGDVPGSRGGAGLALGAPCVPPGRAGGLPGDHPAGLHADRRPDLWPHGRSQRGPHAGRHGRNRPARGRHQRGISGVGRRRQRARQAGQQDRGRCLPAGRLGHPHRAPAGQGQDGHPLSHRRQSAALHRSAGGLPRAAGHAHQDHVRPRYLRAPQAAGRQNPVSPLWPARHRAARGHRGFGGWG